MNKPDQFLITEDMTVKEAMRKMSKVAKRILFVVDHENKLIGSVTDGDIRRWVLNDGDLSASVEKAYNRKPVFVSDHYSIEEVKKLMLRKKFEQVPVVNKDQQIIEVLLWDQIFSDSAEAPKSKINVPVVIMAGGKGTRLDPFTRILPKPLIPVGDRTVLEMIMENFRKFGVKEFYLSINHKAQMIKAYFEEVNTIYKIHYIEETKPLGTVGALSLLNANISGDLMLSNCDILIDADYSQLLDQHRSQGNDLTMVCSFRHYVIPYGICEIKNGGTLVDIKEKPEQDFLANTGMYVLKSDVLKQIPKNEHCDITDLIQTIKDRGGKIGVFPIDEKAWVDIGQLEEYRYALRKLELDQ